MRRSAGHWKYECKYCIYSWKNARFLKRSIRQAWLHRNRSQMRTLLMCCTMRAQAPLVINMNYKHLIALNELETFLTQIIVPAIQHARGIVSSASQNRSSNRSCTYVRKGKATTTCGRQNNACKKNGPNLPLQGKLEEFFFHPARSKISGNDLQAGILKNIWMCT